MGPFGKARSHGSDRMPKKNSNDSGLLFTSFPRSCHSFPLDRIELHIEEKQWEITFSDLRKQHDLTGRNPSLVCQDKLYPWECIVAHLHAKKQAQTSSEPVILINAGMKGNRVGLGQGSGRDEVTPLTLGTTLDSTRTCDYTLHLSRECVIFLKACLYEY